MRKRNQFFRATCMITMACMLAMTGCTREGTEETVKKELLDPIGTTLDTDVVTYRDVVVLETGTGSVTAESVDLQYEVDGNFLACYVENGDFVKKGDVLAEIVQKQVQEQIEALSEDLENAKEQNAFNNQQTEYNLTIQNMQLQKAIEASGIDDPNVQMQTIAMQKAQVQYRQTQEEQQAELDYRQAALDKWTEELGETKLIAPCDGMITGIRFSKYNDYISKDTIVMSITKVDEAGATLDQPLAISASYVNARYMKSCADYYAMINGEKVAVTYVPYTAAELEQLTYYGNSFPAKFTFDETVDVKFGDYVQMCYVTKEALHALSVISNAVYKDATGYYVLLVDSEGNRNRQNVEVGVRNSVYTEIVSGVSEGDVVYVQD